MDLLTHTLLTRRLIGKKTNPLIAGIGPDLPFYLTYPAWVIKQGKMGHALTTNEWPAPPPWLPTLHHAFHSLPIALAGAFVIRVLTRRWPRQEFAAWVLHILIDIPTHSRKSWGPRFLWPFSDLSVEGISWAEILFGLVAVALHYFRKK